MESVELLGIHTLVCLVQSFEILVWNIYGLHHVPYRPTVSSGTLAILLVYFCDMILSRGCFLFFVFLKEKLAPLQDLKHSTLCSKYSTGYFKKPHLVVAPTALPQEDSVVPTVRRECRQPNKQRA